MGYHSQMGVHLCLQFLLSSQATGTWGSQEERRVRRLHDTLLVELRAKLGQALPLRSRHLTELCAFTPSALLKVPP